MKIEKMEKERIDDLEWKDLKIIQDTKGFCFGMDSILLSDFAKEIKKDAMVLDLGTGTGIISVLLCAKTKLKKIYGIEIQEEVAKRATRTSKLNQMEDRFEVICEDIKKIEECFPKNSFDAIVSNPPYKKADTGILNENEEKLISRHEITANLEDFIFVASQMLKQQGEIYLVHRPERLTDIMSLLRKYKLEPKKLRMVHPQQNKEANLILLKAVKGAKSFLRVEKPLIVYQDDQTYTDEILQIYHKK